MQGTSWGGRLQSDQPLWKRLGSAILSAHCPPTSLQAHFCVASSFWCCGSLYFGTSDPWFRPFLILHPRVVAVSISGCSITNKSRVNQVKALRPPRLAPRAEGLDGRMLLGQESWRRAGASGGSCGCGGGVRIPPCCPLAKSTHNVEGPLQSGLRAR